MDSVTKGNPVLLSEPNLASIQGAAVNSGAVNLPFVSSTQKESEIYFQIED